MLQNRNKTKNKETPAFELGFSEKLGSATEKETEEEEEQKEEGDCDDDDLQMI